MRSFKLIAITSIVTRLVTFILYLDHILKFYNHIVILLTYNKLYFEWTSTRAHCVRNALIGFQISQLYTQL